MEEAVVGVVVGASIQVLLQNLLNMSQEQISLFRNFKHDLEELKNSFTMVKAFLYDAEKMQVTNMAVRIWLRNLEALAFEADYVFDEINYELLSKKAGATRNKTVKKKVQSFLSTSNNPFACRLKLGRRIKDINEKLKSINQQAIGFGLQTIAAQAPVSGPDASASRETDSFLADPVFLGRDNDVSTIVEMLINTSLAEKVLSVLPIVGMGGLGKTTLARKVFVDEQIIYHFGDNRFWVYVSRHFDIHNILKNILTSLTGEKFELETREAILKKLQNHLGAKKYLLVLDDHWNGDRDKWDSLVNSLLGISSATGNCMIVTTRSEVVASVVETLPVYKLKGLSEDDSWSIIKAKAFINSGDIPMEFEKMGRKIAERCKGLPLAAKVVGGLLRGKSKYGWLSIEKNWLSDFGDERHMISKILKLSFDHLSPPSLKKCFSYCSIFPKGYLIEKEKLIELWMAEGFLQTDHQRSIITMETTGSKYFNLLLQNSLLQVAFGFDHATNNYNMHDLVHDLACSVLCVNNEGICKSRYIGYKPSGDGLLSIPKGQERYVRTLFFDGKVSDIKFSDFESLQTLTLVGYDTDNLPTSIRELKHLRYLDISRTRIKCLPDSIGELYHLQTLRTDTRSNVEKLPDSLRCLINLRHLHISGGTTLFPEIGKLTSLQILPYFHVGSKKGCEISELGKLKDLKGKLEIRNLEKVRDKNEAMSADLIQKLGIDEIKLVWDGSRVSDEANVDESVLEGLQPHPDLERLEICGFKGKSLPLWTSKMAVQLNGYFWEGLNSLMEIKLEGCSKCEELPMLGHLPQLHYLCLSGLTNVKSIRPSFYGVGTINVVAFPALKRLELRNMINLKEWDEAGDLHSPDLKSIPYPRSRGRHESQQQQQQGFTSLRELCISNCFGLTNFPIEMLESCSLSLEELTLNWSGSLTNISEVIGCLHKMTRLTSLVIDGVPKFSISSGIQMVSSLKSLEMGPDCSWNNVSFNETVDACMLPQFTSLRELTLGGMEHWECLPDGIQHLTSLKYLYLYNYGIEALPEWVGNLSSLEALNLVDFMKLRHFPSKQAMQRLSKLTALFIRSCPLLLKEERSNDNKWIIIDSEWPNISHIPNIFVNGP